MLVANDEFYESIDNSQQDEYDIVLKASKGDKIALEYIIKKYKNFVKAKAKSYFLIGADKEDIIQEGMIGLYKAVRDFDASKTNSFKGFADICITRQIITAIKTATRQKHIPLNSYISLNKPVYDEESERTLLDIIATSIVTDPEELIISKEELKHILRALQNPDNIKDETKYMEIMKRYRDLCLIQSEMAKHQGDRVVIP